MVSVDAGVGNILRTRSQTPGQSEKFGRVLDDPAAGGEVVCRVAVSVPTKTWRTNERFRLAFLTDI